MDFPLHDLKAKDISDLDGTLQEEQEISGHKDIRQTAKYDRKVQEVLIECLAGEIFKNQEEGVAPGPDLNKPYISKSYLQSGVKLV